MDKKIITADTAEQRRLTNNKRAIQQKKKYLKEWDEFFERMKSFKSNYGKTTVPKDFEDQQLYRWFRKQKLIYNHPTQKLPKEHLEKLNSINFYFGDGHREREEKLENKWITLLKEAMASGEKVQTNHRYKYKGKGLGTFLVGVKQDNKKGKKLEAKKKIEALGFNLNAWDRDAITFYKRFIKEIETDKKITKQYLQSRFNSHILPRAETVPLEIREAMSEAWKKRFNEERTWHKIRRFKTPDDFVDIFVKKLLSDENPDKRYYKARFNHSLLERKTIFNEEQKQKVQNAWEFVFKEHIDWSVNIKRYGPEQTSTYFLEDIQDKEHPATKQRFISRFHRSICLKEKAISKKLKKEIDKAWKDRFGTKLEWGKCLDGVDPEKNARKFMDDLLMNTDATKESYFSRMAEITEYKRHWTKEIIEKIEALWRLRFNEDILWYPQKRNNIDFPNKTVDKVKLWKKFRLDKKHNPNEKWITGPKTMGKLYGWVKRLKDNKYALARVVSDFTTEELKEMKRQGFKVDFKLIKKAQDLGLQE